MRGTDDLLDSKEKFIQWVMNDRASCGFSPVPSFKERIIRIVAPNYILRFEYLLRKVEWLTNSKTVFLRNGRLLINRLRLRKIQLKLGFSIPINVFGPGLSIAHYGTIIVSQNASIGCNCRIHACVNIGASAGQDGAPHLGDNVYIGPGAILFGDISIANNVSIGANSTVNKSFEGDNLVIAGTPARIVREGALAWNAKQY